MAAWKALASENLSRPDRIKASAALLRGWIAEDWKSALDKVMSEPPDDFALLDEFEGVFTQQTAEVWEIIASRKYGPLSANLRHHWQSSLYKQNEATLRTISDSLPPAGKLAVLELINSRNPRTVIR